MAPSIQVPETPRLRFVRIRKEFAGVPVLHDLSVDIHAGRITGLVGENGAGKSTLMNLLGGVLRPDAGFLEIDGVRYAPRSPADARDSGVAFVHQELNLFPNLTIAENLALTDLPVRPGLPLIDRRALAARARDLLERVGLKLNIDTLVERLPAGERQLVEIARSLGIRARILILDEPTTSLTTRESDRLFGIMRRLRADGLAVIFISHALGDVLRECDDLVVLRDGALVTTGAAASFDPPRLISAMVGRELTGVFPAAPDSHRPNQPRATGNPPRLSMRSLNQPGVVRNIGFDVHGGEIVGLAGLMGAGRSELARILFGLDPHASGEIRLDGTPLRSGPRRRIQQGLAFLTENRRSDGLSLTASILDNIALVTLENHAWHRFGWIKCEALRRTVRLLRDAVHLSPEARDDQPVGNLSGGNQQKVVLAKWLTSKPSLFILDEPTRGIDVGAKFEIYRLIREFADRGAGILLVSSELEELMGLCDRILVMAKGRIRDEMSRAEFDRERILGAALPE